MRKEMKNQCFGNLEEGFEIVGSQSHRIDSGKPDEILEKPDSRNDEILEKPDGREGILKIVKNQPLEISSNENSIKVTFSQNNTGMIDLDIWIR